MNDVDVVTAALKQPLVIGDLELWTLAFAAAAIATFFVLFAALVFAARQLDEMRKAREVERDSRDAQFLSNVAKRWDSEPLMSCQKALMDFRGDACAIRDYLMNLREAWDPRYLDLMTVAGLFEELGILVERKLVSPDLVSHYLGGAVKKNWQRYEIFVRALREKNRDDSLYEWFQKLAERM